MPMKRSFLVYLRASNNLTASNGKLPFIWLAKKDKLILLMVNNHFKSFSINLNAQHENGRTHFDLALHNGKLVSM